MKECGMSLLLKNKTFCPSCRSILWCYVAKGAWTFLPDSKESVKKVYNVGTVKFLHDVINVIVLSYFCRLSCTSTLYTYDVRKILTETYTEHAKNGD